MYNEGTANILFFCKKNLAWNFHPYQKVYARFGYRHIDTAQAYGNERGVGEGVRTAGVDRDKIFVTSKVAAEHKNYDVTKKSIDETLEKMGLDYIDMMIIHSPKPWKEVNQSDNWDF